MNNTADQISDRAKTIVTNVQSRDANEPSYEQLKLAMNEMCYERELWMDKVEKELFFQNRIYRYHRITE
jgi:hypothetical protein